MASPSMRISVFTAWWWRWYAASVVLVSHLTGRAPDMGKVAYWARRSVRVRIRWVR